jgi:selenocysteine lyase/cysteine desulfurase
MTQAGNESPIASFRVKDVPRTREKLKKAGVVATLSGNQEGYLRVSVSVFNNDQDMDRLIGALS